jgi:hypothetical protein
MNANLYLPGDDLLDQALAEFMGFFWCRFTGGQVVGERIVRFLMSPEQFEEAKAKFGVGSIALASGNELVEQLAYKAVPAYHASRDLMALVEAKLYTSRMWQMYLMRLNDALNIPINMALTAEHHWAQITASPRARSTAAYLVIESQRPKQQVLFG